jgi:hypothetical protein
MKRGLPWLHSLLSPSKKQVVLGTHGWFGRSSIQLNLDTFNSHLYVVGASGLGKSKFLQQVLFQLAVAGQGCAIFDPHADLASDLLAELASYPSPSWLSVPQHRNRVIYLDPSRTDYLMPCNILKSSCSTPYEIAENVVESFRRVWPETLAEAPRFAQILRNAVLVLTLQGLSLLELEPLLTDKAFRMRLLEKTPDPLAVAFFTHQYDKWGREQAIFASPVLNKVSAFLFKPQMRLMLGANDNRLDFRHIIDSGKVFIVNLGGFRDEETIRLLGSLFLTSLEQAAFSRSNQAPAERKPFFAMIDEFPLFCSRDQTSLARMLSELRKFRLHLGLAHQTITQLPGQRIQGALENATLKIIFGTGRQTAEAIVKDLFLPDPKAIKHEVTDTEAQDRTHPIFDPLQEQFEGFTQQIQKQQRQQVLVKLPESEGVIGARTPVVPPPRISPQQLEAWKRYLVQQRGLPRTQIEAEITERTQRFGVPTVQALSRTDSPPIDDDDIWQPIRR